MMEGDCCFSSYAFRYYLIFFTLYIHYSNKTEDKKRKGKKVILLTLSMAINKSCGLFALCASSKAVNP